MKDGRIHSVVYVWSRNENNQIIKLDTYENGIRNGDWKRWDRDGRLEGSDKMDHGIGVLKTFYANMKAKLIEHYKGNEKDGPSVSYHDNGVIFQFTVYKSNHRPPWVFENDNVFVPEVGTPDGVFLSFDRGGSVLHSSSGLPRSPPRNPGLCTSLE